MDLVLWGLAALWASSGLLVIWLVGIDTLQVWRARRDLTRVAGTHASGDGACASTSGPGHSLLPDDPSARPICADVDGYTVTFTPVGPTCETCGTVMAWDRLAREHYCVPCAERWVRKIAPRARIRRRWDGRLLSRRESDAVLADVFGETR